uniref:hypothetical protein n=1 Tax=Spirosoma arboris TaxID=2682092 RepID=UPI003742EF2A
MAICYMWNEQTHKNSNATGVLVGTMRMRSYGAGCLGIFHFLRNDGSISNMVRFGSI